LKAVARYLVERKN